MKVQNIIRNGVHDIAKEAKLSRTLEDEIVLNPKQVNIACTNHERAYLWALDVVVVDAPNPSHRGPQKLKDPCYHVIARVEAIKEAAYKEGREDNSYDPLPSRSWA